MYQEVMLIPLTLHLLIFLSFFITSEGSRWQRHKYLGVFARFIQASPRRGFLVFLTLTIAIIPVVEGLMWGMWYDAILLEAIPANTTPIVMYMLLAMLLLAAMIPVMYSHYGTWRQSVRSAADVKVRSTTN